VCTDATQVFATKLMTRTHPKHRSINTLIHGGEASELQRVNWILTDWSCTDACYTYGSLPQHGEAGSLLDQCCHNLEIMQWLCGMPVP
jgi:predicted dehydrogenase